MLYSNLVKRKKRRILIAISIVLASFLFTSKIFAESISPFYTEDKLISGSNKNYSLTIDNKNDYDLFVTPKVYKYYPKSEYISELEPFEEFVKIDTDYIEIPSGSEREINFQIVAPQALDPGTYYNLIVFQQTGQTVEENEMIGATGAISHLVKLHLISDNSDKVTDQYDISLEVIDRGIPFLKPAILKLTFFNNSPYTLIPKGEIQVVKKSGNKPPEYIKVNLDRVRAYPKDTVEFEYEIENWYIEDIFFGKTAYIQIGNGIDESVIRKEIQIPGFRNEFLYILATITVIVLLATSLKGDTKPEPEYAE
jgi:hypothetical protein